MSPSYWKHIICARSCDTAAHCLNHVIALAQCSYQYVSTTDPTHLSFCISALRPSFSIIAHCFLGHCFHICPFPTLSILVTSTFCVMLQKNDRLRTSWSLISSVRPHLRFVYDWCILHSTHPWVDCAKPVSKNLNHATEVTDVNIVVN